MFDSLRQHWREYFIEAWGLGIFMISACGFGVLLFHPAMPVADWDFWVRNTLMGCAMGSTAIFIFLSPWGKRSGSHINPSVTLTFFRLGKIKPWDAVFYVIAQFVGSTIAVLLSWLVFGKLLEDAAVNFVVTVPNQMGAGVSFFAEFLVSFLMMTMVLITTNSITLSRFTPYIAGLMVALYISVEAPISGMSMNPARTFASAAIANVWTDWWVYFTAPPLGMLTAAEIFIRLRGLQAVYCAKFHHNNSQSCPFICGYHDCGNKDGVIEVTKNAHLFTSAMKGLFKRIL